ncbi:hypothetical protein SADUNF_Sadunf17G0134400 [Salix dunnii]|uniref:Uncharacterized protein n=1 Tax=Salix dunnii TaxID=1413687 RepID=A0A835J9I9_9ROSI|nr:hypothetical protein SADUNF_Sadunf17G0134400 [Salix dunnii]
MVLVRQISLQWSNVVLEFCLQAAIQIALQYETTQHPKLPVSFYLQFMNFERIRICGTFRQQEYE